MHVIYACCSMPNLCDMFIRLVIRCTSTWRDTCYIYCPCLRFQNIFVRGTNNNQRHCLQSFVVHRFNYPSCTLRARVNHYIFFAVDFSSLFTSFFAHKSMQQKNIFLLIFHNVLPVTRCIFSFRCLEQPFTLTQT